MKFEIVGVIEHEDGSATYSCICDQAFKDFCKKIHGRKRFTEKLAQKVIMDALTSYMHSLIPKGMYCYTPTGESGIGKDGIPFRKIDPCPFWKQDRRRREQERGYCTYLGKGDWDLNKEGELYQINKDGSKTLIKKKGEPTVFPMSLLWDQCKECNINIDDEEEK